MGCSTDEIFHLRLKGLKLKKPLLREPDTFAGPHRISMPPEPSRIWKENGVDAKKGCSGN